MGREREEKGSLHERRGRKSTSIKDVTSPGRETGFYGDTRCNSHHFLLLPFSSVLRSEGISSMIRLVVQDSHFPHRETASWKRVFELALLVNMREGEEDRKENQNQEACNIRWSSRSGRTDEQIFPSQLTVLLPKNS